MWDEEFGKNDFDITKEFYQLVDELDPGTVLHEPLFDLLEGTRAMEIGNAVMDTGMISIESCDADFDAGSDLTSAQVLELQCQLLVAFASWLDNSTLPVTILGSRHVSFFLEAYKMARLKGDPLQHALKWGKELQKSNLLFAVLGPFIAGLCKAIGISLKIAETVLFEEEDITTHAMNLDFLGETASLIVVQEIDKAILFLKENDRTPESSLIGHALLIVRLFVQMEYIVCFRLDLFHETDLRSIDFLLVAADLTIKLCEAPTSSLPKGWWSRIAQRYFDNGSLPLPLYIIPRKKAFDDLGKIFKSIHTVIKGASKIRTVAQIDHYLRYDIELEAAKMNVLARGIFQLFLVREDHSLFGSSLGLRNLAILKVEEFVGPDLALFKAFGPDSLLKLRVSDPEWVLLLSKFSELLSLLQGALFETIYVYGSNVCRHHQLRSKLLIALDSLQVRWEEFESDMFQKYGVGEHVHFADASVPNEPALAISSYIFAEKLLIMTSVVLNGIALELYRDYELCQIYWQISVLLEVVCDHYETRRMSILNSRAHSIQVSLPKRIKKLKAGPKKDVAKDLQKYNMERVLPEIMLCKLFGAEYTHKPLKAFQQLVRGRLLILQILHKMSIYDFKSGPCESLATREAVFNLRIKPFLSVGCPEPPLLKSFLDSLHDAMHSTAPAMIIFAREILLKARTLYQGIIAAMKTNDKAFYRSSVDNNVMIQECISLCAVVHQDMQIIDELELIFEKVSMEYSPQYRFETVYITHRYFPSIKIIDSFQRA